MTVNEHDWLSKRLDKLEEKLDEVRMEVVALKTKAALWGGGAGLVLAAIITKLVSG